MESPKNILVFTHFFVPGSKAGGPARSLDALTSTRDDRIRFWVVTSDRDSGDAHPYSEVAHDQWVRQGGRLVTYFNFHSLRSYFLAVHRVRRVKTDLYYFNSLWARHFTIIPLLLILFRVLPRAPIVLAPRGEVLAGALGSKAIRKRLGFIAMRALLAWLGVTLHATSPAERVAIERCFPQHVIEHPDLFVLTGPVRRQERMTHRLRLIYLSRIHPHKNLLCAIEAARHVTVPMEFRVVGSSGNDAYFKKCLEAAKSLPSHVRVTFSGHVMHSRVSDELASADVFILPTKSENFGHAIREALAHACIPIVSETTPWTDLLQRAGLPTPAPDDEAAFAQALVEITSLPKERLEDLRDGVANIYSIWEAEQRHSRDAMCDKLVNLVSRDVRPPA